jgi:hypothetical protein
VRGDNIATLSALAAAAGTIFAPPPEFASGYRKFPRNSFLAARRDGRRRAHRNRRKAARS